MNFLACVSYRLPFPVSSVLLLTWVLSLPASTCVFVLLSPSVCLHARSLTLMILGLETPAAPTPVKL